MKARNEARGEGKEGNDGGRVAPEIASAQVQISAKSDQWRRGRDRGDDGASVEVERRSNCSVLTRGAVANAHGRADRRNNSPMNASGDPKYVQNVHKRSRKDTSSS